MTIYVYRKGKLVDRAKAAPFGAGAPGFYIQQDEMPLARHMVDGKYYSSKRKFRAATRAAGCVEVGDQTHVLTAPRKPVQLDRGRRREQIREVVRGLAKEGRLWLRP